ncbi:MAG: hypothetical protein JO307_04585 [Bryobacterales bacterium]|nr:hypothetical protein [Bryobacterales bacterium]MBV9399669.1 hypothetical protein [Bryobacterales bacterium]
MELTSHVSSVGVTRPIVKFLFVASVLLSIVSWYTTQQGMALYLSTWFSLLASLGIQTALVFVAWLIGFTKAKKALLIAVYAITAAISISFSYVSLFTWFSSRERPMQVERKLYDKLNETADRASQLLASAIAEGQKHVAALNEMTAAEKTNGYISRAQDADPYLAHVREAVAREARTYSPTYKEGSGEGLRYTAFDRYAKLAEQSVQRMQDSQKSVADLRANLKPLDPTDQQLRQFRQVYDAVPWNDVEESLHATNLEKPALPGYADFVDRTASEQEDLMVAFQELFGAPTVRHFFSLALAAFIDIVVFLLAYASGPYFFGSAERRWFAAGAALDSGHEQVFVRDFLRKLRPDQSGLTRADADSLTPGETQVCCLLVSKGLATTAERDGRVVYLLGAEIHEQLLELMASPDLRVRAAVGQA